ncbi:hypothetical protein BH10CHL1_BH10CHL1_21010 [soil metagenome]
MKYDSPAFTFTWRRLGYSLIAIFIFTFVLQTLGVERVYGQGGPDLVIHKSADVSKIAPGGTIVYTLDYNNTSLVDAVGVSITELVPANTQFVLGQSTLGWLCLPDASAGPTCTFPLLVVAAGASGSVNFAVKVIDPVPASVTAINNTASISDDGLSGADSNPNDNIDTITTPLDAAPDFSLTKSDGDISSAPGGSIVYTLNYANNGNQDATNVTLHETVPAHTIFTGAGWACTLNNNAGSNCTKSIGDLPAGKSGSASFAVTVVNPVPSGVIQISNSASIDDGDINGADPTPGNNSGSDTTPVTATPDLSIAKRDNGVAAIPGGTIIYTLNYTNTGNQEAVNLEIADTVPANTTFQPNGSSVGWTCTLNGNAGGVCKRTLASLNGGGAFGSSTFAVTIANSVPAAVTQIANTATIHDDASNGIDPTTGNNSGTATTSLTAAPDLVLRKSDGGASATPGGTIVYTLNYTNTGNQGATGVVLVETVPANTQFKAASSSPNWNCLPNISAGSTCKLTLGALASGVHNSALFAVTVVNPVPIGVTQIANTASINDDGGNGPDATPANNSASDTTPLTASPKLLLDKRHDVSVAEPGKTILYTLVYTNAGNQDAAGVVLTETVPANTKFNASGSTTGWTCTPSGGDANSVCKFAIGSVAGGAHASINFAVTVASSLPNGVTQISNTVVIGDNRTPNAASDTDVTPVKAAAGLLIQKSDGGITVKPGATLVYTLNYTNTGNQTAAGVMITETVPANTRFAGDATVWNCSSTAPGAICKHASGDLGGSVGGSLSFVVRVDNPLPAGVVQISNVAKIGHSAAANVDESSTATPVDAAPDLALTKNDNNVKVKPGEGIVYTLGYGNHGNQDATGVVIHETVPDNTSFAPTASSSGWNCTGSACTYGVGNVAAGATGAVTFAVHVNDNLPLGVAQVTNSATLNDDASNGSDLDPTDNTATDTTLLSVSFALIATKQATLAVDADGNQAASPGDTLEYLITLSNSGNSSLNNVNFQDSLDANTQLVAGNSIQTSQGNVFSGNNVTDQTVQVAVGVMAANTDVEIRFRVKVKSPLTGTVSKIVNQGVVKSTELPDVLTDDPTVVGPSDPTVTTLSTPVVLRVTLTDYLFADADEDDKVSGGDTLLYRLTVFNVGNAGINDLVIDDTPGTQSTLIAGTVRTDQGEYVTGNATGDTHLQIHIDAELPSGGRATISFQVKVNKNVTANQIINRAQVAVKPGANPIIVLSDDPDTGPSGDATTTPVGGRLPSPSGGKLYLPTISKR